ncbi:MAG: phage tail protein [Bacteroidales bacterium]|nr:phage tail protein [Bacteroidales bacterium]
MIPILYDSNETQFISNGLGRLSDAISCKVTEEANGAYELTMQYSITGKHYNDLAMTRYIYAKPSDGKDPQPFSIYKISKPLNGICTIYAEHISYQLNYIPVMPFRASSCLLALQGLKENAAEDCPFNFYTDKTVETEYVMTEPAMLRARLGGTEGSILQRYKGEFEWDKWDVHLWNHRGIDNGVVLRYGKNITSLTQDESIENTYTGVCPYWVGRNEDGTNYSVVLPEKVLHSENADRYPYQRTVMLNTSDHFREPPTVEDLRSYAQAYMENNAIGVPKVNVKVSFVPLWQSEEYRDVSDLERVNLFDTITVVFEELGVSATAYVIETDYDVLKERYISVTVGDVKSNLTDTLVKQSEETTQEIQNSMSRMEQSLAIAGDKITGGLGGYVVINRNANGEPNELLVMDSPDISTAVNVIRFNEAGIGFSQNGYDGPFNSAWTIDGHLDMSQIDVMNIRADMFQGGAIDLGSLENQSGVLRLFDENNALVGIMDKDGLRMYGPDGSYVLMNQQEGFVGKDVRGNPIYWVSSDEFHMRKGVMDEEITLCNKLRFVPMETYRDNVLFNDGIGLVSVSSAGAATNNTVGTAKVGTAKIG